MTGATASAAVEGTLRRVFGHAAFRPGQAEILDAILGGDDVLAVMPTGAGKSLLYQLPACTGHGPVVVVSPLISLMRDQVGALQSKGVAAGALHSAIEPDDAERVMALINARRIALLYLAPERLTLPGTIETLRRLRPRILAVDEAHCVSRWADDFRPDYARIADVAKAVDVRQVVAVTATAGPRTRADIAARLFARPPREFVRSFARPNIALSFRPRRELRADVRRIVTARAGESGIVYCASRASTDRLARDLGRAGLPALPYHAGLDPVTRDRNQDRFLRERGTTMVATIAFGMGIDKPDVRFVLHADLPHSLEAYYQEIGRAGRDGAPATAIALVDGRRAHGPLPPDAAAVLALANHPGCRWQALLAAFGERSQPCGVCDLCAHDPLRLRRAALAAHRTWAGLRARAVAQAERLLPVRATAILSDVPEPTALTLPAAEALAPSLLPLTVTQQRLRTRLAEERARIARHRRVPPASVADAAALDALARGAYGTGDAVPGSGSAGEQLSTGARDLLAFARAAGANPTNYPPFDGSAASEPGRGGQVSPGEHT